jgi:hypothetical protein
MKIRKEDRELVGELWQFTPHEANYLFENFLGGILTKEEEEEIMVKAMAGRGALNEDEIADLCYPIFIKEAIKKHMIHEDARYRFYIKGLIDAGLVEISGRSFTITKKGYDAVESGKWRELSKNIDLMDDDNVPDVFIEGIDDRK